MRRFIFREPRPLSPALGLGFGRVLVNVFDDGSTQAVLLEITHDVYGRRHPHPLVFQVGPF